MQAARGTPVDDRESGPDEPRAPRLAAPRTWLLFALVAAFLLATDQVTKHLAVTRLTDQPDVRVVGEVLQLHLTYNPGAAFSLGTRFTVALAVLASVATVVILWLSRRLGSRIWAVAMGLLLAGITGNLSDRIFREPGPLRGHVVDFLMLPNWPVFNVADICINVGVALILVQVFRGIELDGSRLATKAGPAPDAAGEPDGDTGDTGDTGGTSEER